MGIINSTTVEERLLRAGYATLIASAQIAYLKESAKTVQYISAGAINSDKFTSPVSKETSLTRKCKKRKEKKKKKRKKKKMNQNCFIFK